MHYPYGNWETALTALYPTQIITIFKQVAYDKMPQYIKPRLHAQLANILLNVACFVIANTSCQLRVS